MYRQRFCSPEISFCDMFLPGWYLEFFFLRVSLKLNFFILKLFCNSIQTASLLNLFRYSGAEVIMVSQSNFSEDNVSPITPSRIYFLCGRPCSSEDTAISLSLSSSHPHLLSLHPTLFYAKYAFITLSKTSICFPWFT